MSKLKFIVEEINIPSPTALEDLNNNCCFIISNLELELDDINSNTY